MGKVGNLFTIMSRKMNIGAKGALVVGAYVVTMGVAIFIALLG